MKSRMHFKVLYWLRAVIGVLFKTFVIGLVLANFSLATANEKLWQTLDSSLIQSSEFEGSNLEIQARNLKDLGSSYSSPKSSSNHSFENAKLMTLNESLMYKLLSSNYSSITTSDINTSGVVLATRSLAPPQQFKISLPLPNGELIDISLMKNSVLSSQLAAKYPDINTYNVLSNKLVFSGKVDISPSGFHAMLQMMNGEVVFIDPTDVSLSEYAIYNKSAQKADSHQLHSCGLSSEFSMKSMFSSNNRGLLVSPLVDVREVAARTQDSLKNYTIAIATTGEYSAKFGGNVSATMAAITTTLNRVNQILERDLGIHLNLVDNNDLLINTDSSSDPFTKNTLLDLVFQNQDFIDSTIGTGNYDIGHLFTTRGGGLAAIGSVCHSTKKAKAVSGTTSPKGDSFDLDFVAHEIGHQLGATHTFNSSQGACSAETRTARTAFEPGSGSSIMSYAGNCGLDNIQSSTDPMYHIGSINQIMDYTENGLGSSCGVVKSSLNTPPLVDAGKSYTIPARTPFELKGEALDQDGDSLVFAWEQLDAGEASTESLDTGDNALFRVHAPNASKSRSFPPLKNLLNQTSVRGEALPNHERNLTMSFVAQDGFNAAQSDEMIVKVVRTGSRFALHYPRAYYNRGSTFPIYWNVANTDIAPINCTSVDVWLSVDGGNEFSYSVANNIPNTGKTEITIPADVPVSAQGRFKINCSDNIFFAVSYRNFLVTEYANSVSTQYDDEDQAELNLKDSPLTIEVIASPTTFDNFNNNGSGGGVFDHLIYLFLLFFAMVKLVIISPLPKRQ